MNWYFTFVTYGLIYFYIFFLVIYADLILGFKEYISKRFAVFSYGMIGVLLFAVALEYNIQLTFAVFMVYIMIFFMLRISCKGDLLAHLFLSGTVILFVSALFGTSSTIISWIYGVELLDVVIIYVYNYQAFVITFIVAIFFVIYFSYFMNLSKMKLVLKNKKQLYLLNIVQLLLIVIMIISYEIFFLYVDFVGYTIYFFIQCILIMLAFLTLFSYVIRYCVLEEYEIGYRVYEKQLIKQVESYNTQMQYVKNLRKFKHDFKHFQRLVHTIAHSDDPKKIDKILDELNVTLENVTSTFVEYSNDTFLQSILTHAANVCQSRGVIFEATVIVPDNLNFTELELTRVMSNVVDNALEATAITKISSYIKINSAILPNWYTISCVNNFDGFIMYQNDEIVTRKIEKNSHGFGLKNIHEIIESKGGFVKINVDKENNEFQINLHIPIDK